MTNIKLCVNGASARAYVNGPLTAGAAGIPVLCVFDEAWNGLTPHLVAVTTGTARDMVISADGLSVVPWEVLKENARLLLAIDGKNADGSIRIPTVWADCGTVRPSPGSVKREGSEPPPTPSEIEQLMALVRRAENKVKPPYINPASGNWMVWDDAEKAFVDSGLPSTGQVDEETVERILNEYLQKHPLKSDWASVENKPFERLGESLKVVDGTLDVNAFEVANQAGGNTLVIG